MVLPTARLKRHRSPERLVVTEVAALRVFDALGPDDAIDAASIVSELNDALRKPDVLALLARTGTEFGTPQDHA